jgi:uncharacterized protein
MFRLSRITIYPIKSLDGLRLDEAEVLPNGALTNDRRFAIRDTQGACVNGKANPNVHLVRAQFSADAGQLTLTDTRNQRSEAFALPGDVARLEEWLGEFFGKRVLLVENLRGGFPDDTDSPGPTIVSRQTMDEVSRWFAGVSPDQVRQRFRANLEIEGDAPFCEDRLFSDTRHVVRFQIGEVHFEGVNPCQRCIVPTRHPQTAEMYHAFSREFARHRKAAFPSWIKAERFDHFYRLAVNTRPSPLGTGGTIRVGDEVRIGAVVTA